MMLIICHGTLVYPVNESRPANVECVNVNVNRTRTEFPGRFCVWVMVGALACPAQREEAHRLLVSLFSFLRRPQHTAGAIHMQFTREVIYLGNPGAQLSPLQYSECCRKLSPLAQRMTSRMNSQELLKAVCFISLDRSHV